jgi:phosphoglycolate phosphatase
VTVRHAAFDLDGTLIDSGADLVAAVNHVLGSFGRAPIDPPTLAQYVGHGARALVERVLGPAEAAQVDEGVARFMRYYGAHLLEETRAYPGIEALLDGLAERGVVLTVLTNKPEALSRAILAGLRLADRFVALVGGDTLPTRKPDPTGLLQLCRTAGAAPDQSLMVGDSPVDLETARAAGAPFCGVAWGLQPAVLVAAGPAWMVRGPGEVLAGLAAIPGRRLDSTEASG